MKNFKLLINCADGVQRLESYGEGGGYFDPSCVIFDERVDGPFPQSMEDNVGGIIVSGKPGSRAISVNSEMLLAARAASLALSNAIQAKKDQVAAAQAELVSLQAKLSSGTANIADINKILKDMLSK